MIHECIHCKKNLITFKACRINGSAYIEQYLNQTSLRVWKHRDKIPKEEWQSVYEEFKAEAEKLTQEFEADSEAIRNTPKWNTPLT